MTPLEIAGWILLALLGLAGSWLCSGMETGMYTLNRIRLMVRAERIGGTARLLRREVDRPEHLLGTILIGNNVFAYLAAASITALLAGYGYADTQILIINILILTPLILIFCEALPKELFRLEADRLCPIFAPVIAAMRLVLTALLVVPLVVRFSRAAARLIGVEGEVGLAVSARERVATLLKEAGARDPAALGTDGGGLSPGQVQLVDRALAFHRLRIGDEMVPWSRVVAIRANWDRRRVMRLMAQRPFSRYPVIEPAREVRSAGGLVRPPPFRVAGMVRQADFFTQPDATIRELIVEPVRLSPATPLRDALQRLREDQSGMIVVERGGQALGIASVKDLAEPLTGVLEE
jgi:putative hemolysin